jgi:hypothetical protein
MINARFMVPLRPPLSRHVLRHWPPKRSPSMSLIALFNRHFIITCKSRQENARHNTKKPPKLPVAPLSPATQCIHIALLRLYLWRFYTDFIRRNYNGLYAVYTTKPYLLRYGTINYIHHRTN